MPEQSAPKGFLAGLKAMPNDSPRKMLIVAVSLCLVCSVVVSSAAVMLRPLQERNELLAKRKEILKVAGLYQPERAVAELFEQVQTRIMDLQSGKLLEEGAAPVQLPLDTRHVPTLSIPPERDKAGIGVRPRYIPVYFVREQGRVQTVILPVHGKGLWSTLYGFIALAGDGRTIRGLSFYDHEETPGLGGEIDNPRWRAQWQGKQAYGPEGEVRIDVLKGTVNPDSPQSQYQVDGLAGATLTARGVENLIRYWLGEQGYGPFLAGLRERGDSA